MELIKSNAPDRVNKTQMRRETKRFDSIRFDTTAQQIVSVLCSALLSSASA